MAVGQREICSAVNLGLQEVRFLHPVGHGSVARLGTSYADPELLAVTLGEVPHESDRIRRAARTPTGTFAPRLEGQSPQVKGAWLNVIQDCPSFNTASRRMTQCRVSLRRASKCHILNPVPAPDDRTMDFPIFHLDGMGNRMLVAVVAVLHVLINHGLAVGAMPLITALEWWGERTGDRWQRGRISTVDI